MPYVLTQEKFCAEAGIQRRFCQQLRDLGYIPSSGVHPVYIPVKTGLEGLELYIQDCAVGQIGKNARFKRVVSA